MTRASNLVGAFLFAGLAWIVSDLVKAEMPEGMALGLMSPVNALFGLLMGWRVMGSRAGDGYVQATGHGLTTVFSITLWCLLVWAAYEMVRTAVRTNVYQGSPMKALQGMADEMVQYAALIATWEIALTAVIGGFVCAMITEYLSHRWS